MRSPFRRYNVPLSRQTGGAYVGGVWTPGATVPLAPLCSVQPTPGRELLSLPEGRRLTESYMLITDEPMFTVNEQNPDVVVIFGQEHEVVKTAPWQNGVLNHFAAFTVRRSQQVGAAA